jgi:hypothetical protein
MDQFFFYNFFFHKEKLGAASTVLALEFISKTC